MNGSTREEMEELYSQMKAPHEETASGKFLSHFPHLNRTPDLYQQLDRIKGANEGGPAAIRLGILDKR